MKKAHPSSAKTKSVELPVSTFLVAPPFDVQYRNAKAPFPVGPHSHNASELYFTLTDLPDVLLNDKVFAVPAGTLLIIPAFCVHQLYHETDVTYERYILNIHEGWLDAALCDGASRFSFLKSGSTPQFIFPTNTQKKELLRLFSEMLSSHDPATPDSLTIFFQFLSKLLEMTKNIPSNQGLSLPTSPSQRRINEILSYVQDHVNDNLSVNDLAAHFYLHPDYLARMFKSKVHVPIGRYLILQRISAAQAFLREGHSVAWVQEALHFSSYAYFFKTFQKITGISPSKYRGQFLKDKASRL